MNNEQEIKPNDLSGPLLVEDDEDIVGKNNEKEEQQQHHIQKKYHTTKVKTGDADDKNTPPTAKTAPLQPTLDNDRDIEDDRGNGSQRFISGQEKSEISGLLLMTEDGDGNGDDDNNKNQRQNKNKTFKYKPTTTTTTTTILSGNVNKYGNASESNISYHKKSTKPVKKGNNRSTNDYANKKGRERVSHASTASSTSLPSKVQAHSVQQRNDRVVGRDKSRHKRKEDETPTADNGLAKDKRRHDRRKKEHQHPQTSTVHNSINNDDNGIDLDRKIEGIHENSSQDYHTNANTITNDSTRTHTRARDDDSEESVEAIDDDYDDVRPGAVRVCGVQSFSGVESTRNVLMDDIPIQRHQQELLQQHQEEEEIMRYQNEGEQRIPSIMPSVGTSIYSQSQATLHGHGSFATTGTYGIYSGYNGRRETQLDDIGMDEYRHDHQGTGTDDGPIVAELAPDEEDVAKQVEAQVAERFEQERKKTGRCRSRGGRR